MKPETRRLLTPRIELASNYETTSTCWIPSPCQAKGDGLPHAEGGALKAIGRGFRSALSLTGRFSQWKTNPVKVELGMGPTAYELFRLIFRTLYKIF